ncbi:MAG: hypothetical protein AAF360_03175, partial [Pseudomonadota bacterium]
MTIAVKMRGLTAPGDCPSTRRALMRLTDYGMLAYWLITALAAVGALSLPGAWLFKDYHLSHSIAWPALSSPSRSPASSRSGLSVAATGAGAAGRWSPSRSRPS